MCRVVHLFALLCFVVVLCGAQSVNAQDEEQIFGHEEAVVSRVSPALIPAPQHPATAYWKVSATMDLRFASPGTHVQMLLPLSDERQSVLERRTSAEGVSYREEADGLNLWGHWLVTKTPTVPQQITYDYTVQITDSAQSLPSVLFPLRNIPVSARIYVQPSGVIQSDAPEVRQQAVALTRTSRSVERAIRTLFEYTVALVSLDSGSAKNDALTVITEQRASRMGKTRALVALLRAVGIPARIVGGIRLGDTAVKRTTIAWVEAFVDHSWIPMDPAGGYFAWLPNTYLALYRDDLPLLTHSRKVPVEYSFFIRQVSRNVVLPERANGGRRRDRERLGIRHEAEHGHTIATYVDNPRASVVLINDGPIPRGTVDRILADARQVQLNVAVLSADFESSYSRERYLQSLVSNNLTLIREADLLLISTADTAAMYALLKQGELGVRLDDLRVVIASGVLQPVATIFAAVGAQLLRPAEIVLVGRQPDFLQLWDLGRTYADTPGSLAKQAERRGLSPAVISAETVEGWSWWRRHVVRLWTLAVQAQVPLPALNLILVLPLIAFFLVIIRNVIGLETFGTFSPMLLALAFLTTGLLWGLVVFFIIVGLGTGLRFLLQRFRLHLVSRVAILIAVVAVGMVGLTVLGATLGIGALLHVGIFPMVIMANTIENFTNTQLERGPGEALRLTVNTLLVATCSYVGIENTGLKPLVLTFPEVLILVIGIELLLGRWRGLRLIEYLRFAALMRRSAGESTTETQKASII